MKTKTLLALLAMSLTMLFACEKTEDLGAEEVTISPADTTYEFPAEGGEYTISLTATIDWELQGYDEDVQAWLSITPTSGSASAEPQTVTIVALENEGYSRSASITFYGNILNNVTVTFTQEGAIEIPTEGDGTVDNPYSVYTAMQVIDEYGYSYNSPSEDVYVKGIITEITEVDTGDYGNATYYISDSEGGEYSIYVYRGYYLENTRFTSADQISVGDEVVVCGQLMLFYQNSVGIYEIGSGNYIYSHNGVTEADQEPEVGVPSGDGSLDSPYNVAGARQAIADNGWTSSNPSGWVYVAGEISSIANVQIDQYGSISYYIKDADYDNSLYVYGGKYLNNESFTSEDQIKVGDEVVVYGQLINYNGLYEFTNGNYLYSLNGNTGDTGNDPGSDQGPTSATYVTIAEFLDMEVNTTDWYQLTGTITSIANTSYGNFYMEDATGSVYVYGLTSSYVASNDRSFSNIGLEVGDEVTIWTLRAEYNGEAQAGGTPPAIYISHTEGSDPVYPDGTVTLTFPDDNSDNNKVQVYTSTWQAQSGDNWFEIAHFNNNNWSNWTYIRCGHSTTAYTAYIVNITAMPELSSIELSVGSRFYTDYVTPTLEIYSDAALTTQVGSTISPTGTYATNSTLTYEIPAANRAENLYYKLVFDCQASGGSTNGLFEVQKLVYLAAE